MAVVPARIIQPQAKGQWPPQETRRARKDLTQDPQRGAAILLLDFPAIQVEDECLLIQATRCTICCDSHLRGLLGRCIGYIIHVTCTEECGASHGPPARVVKCLCPSVLLRSWSPTSNHLSWLNNNSRQMGGFAAFHLQGTSSFRLINGPSSVLSRERTQVLHRVWESTLQNL